VWVALVGGVQGVCALFADLLGGAVVDAGRCVPPDPGMTVIAIVPAEEVLAELPMLVNRRLRPSGCLGIRTGHRTWW
jgi:hypothetical protein